MPKNMTISIPDALFEALKTVKGEVPISRTCSIALQNAISNVNTYVTSAKIRFSCFSFDEAERMAFDAGMKWAAEDAPIEQIIFIALSRNKEELAVYADYHGGLDTLIEKYGDDKDLVKYRENEIIWSSPEVIPHHLIQRHSDERHDLHDIVGSFLDGVRVIWKHIEPFVRNEVDSALGEYTPLAR